MKEKLIGLMAAALLMGAVSASAWTPAPLDRSYVSLEATALGPNYVKVLSESTKNEALNQAVIQYMGMTAEEAADTKINYNYVDLDGDGKKEAIAVLCGMYTSGTGGDTLVILSDNNGWKVDQVLTLARSPVIITDKIIHGMKGIIMKRAGGGAKAAFVLLTAENGKYQSVNDGKEISLSDYKGKAFIADDLILDDYLGLDQTL